LLPRERCFCRLKIFTRIATCYDKLARKAEGAKPGSPMNFQEAQRQMHAQPAQKAAREADRADEQARGAVGQCFACRVSNQCSSYVICDPEYRFPGRLIGHLFGQNE
jgi:hypothetical protein